MTMLSTRRRNRESAARAGAAAGGAVIRVSGGYLPSVIYAEAGAPIRLVFIREETATCSEQVLFPAFGKSAMLPAGKRIAVDLPACPPGTYEFTCAMGILRGRLVVTWPEIAGPAFVRDLHENSRSASQDLQPGAR
jgi:plastocyanin domain-containing protein